MIRQHLAQDTDQVLPFWLRQPLPQVSVRRTDRRGGSFRSDIEALPFHLMGHLPLFWQRARPSVVNP